MWRIWQAAGAGRNQDVFGCDDPGPARGGVGATASRERKLRGLNKEEARVETTQYELRETLPIYRQEQDFVPVKQAAAHDAGMAPRLYGLALLFVSSALVCTLALQRLFPH